MGSFRKRLLVLIIGLVAVTQTVTLAAVLASTAHNVEARAAQQLRSGASFVQQLIRFRAGQLASGVAILAADFGFREAVASNDAPTIRSAANNNARRIGADLVLVLDTQGRVVVATADVGTGALASLADLLDDPRETRDLPHFTVLGNRTYQFFVAPVRAPETIAWVAMGFAIDDSFARKLRELVGSHVTLVAYGKDGTAHLSSTLPRSARQLHPAGSSSTPIGAATRVGLESASDRFLTVTQRLQSRGDAIDVTLQEPMGVVLAPYRDVRDALLLIDGIALALAAAIGAFLGRSATRPIGQLVEAAHRIQLGRYEVTVEAAGGNEFRSLAAAFNAMQRTIAEREADITHQVFHDSVTGLPNRALAERRLEDLIRSAGGESAALILIAMRNVREINGSFGHHVGDEVLREAARRLRQNAAATDVVARVAESQFLVIARNCTVPRASLYADQLAAVVRSGFHVAGMSLDLTVGAAICVYPDHGAGPADLLRRVQIALEDADATRGRIATYRAGTDEAHRRRLALITDLRTALSQDGLTLVYQPKVTIASRSVKSLEALVRWTHPQLGNVSPGEFVPLAEATGNSRDLTSWVLTHAVRQLRNWRREGLEVELAVNLSAPDILDPQLGDEILRLLRECAVPASSLILEITESAVMRDPQLAARHMQLLRIAGVRFSIDDFGTGHSSLAQLSRLPVDELKIDRSFVMGARQGSDAATIITSTIELGHSMGLRVVGEGVEEADAWNLLRALGCDYAQGYLISPPILATQIPAFVHKANQLLPASDSTVQQIRVLGQLTGGARD